MIRFFTDDVRGNVLAEFEIELEAIGWTHVIRGKIVIGNYSQDLMVIWPNGSPRYPHYARNRDHDAIAKQWIKEEWYKWQK